MEKGKNVTLRPQSRLSQSIMRFSSNRFQRRPDTFAVFIYGLLLTFLGAQWALALLLDWVF